MNAGEFMDALHDMREAALEALHDEFTKAHGLPPKPLYGTPCNGCGLCCVVEQCPLSEKVFGPQPLCPAIVIQPGRVVCGLIERPASHVDERVADLVPELATLLLGVGHGCDAVHTDQDREQESLLDRDSTERASALVRSGRVEAIIDQMAQRLGKVMP